MLITGLETLIFRGRIHRNEIWKERERKKAGDIMAAITG